MLILNIGLDTKHRGKLHVQVISAALIGRCIVPVYCGTFDSDSEQSAVYIVNDATRLQIWRLCETLAQEAIAVYDPRAARGRIIGPGADAWGEFDAARFIMPTGERLGGVQ